MWNDATLTNWKNLPIIRNWDPTKNYLSLKKVDGKVVQELEYRAIPQVNNGKAVKLDDETLEAATNLVTQVLEELRQVFTIAQNRIESRDGRYNLRDCANTINIMIDFWNPKTIQNLQTLLETATVQNKSKWVGGANFKKLDETIAKVKELNIPDRFTYTPHVHNDLIIHESIIAKGNLERRFYVIKGFEKMPIKSASFAMEIIKAGIPTAKNYEKSFTRNGQTGPAIRFESIPHYKYEYSRSWDPAIPVDEIVSIIEQTVAELKPSFVICQNTDEKIVDKVFCKSEASLNKSILMREHPYFAAVKTSAP